MQCFDTVGWESGRASGVRCRLFAYYPTDATASQNPHLSLASFKSRLVLPFCYRLTEVVLEKRLLNGCSVVVKKGKVFPYSLPSIGPAADPGVQTVSPQMT